MAVERMNANQNKVRMSSMVECILISLAVLLMLYSLGLLLRIDAPR